MFKLDRYDQRILDILARDGRIAKSRLAEQINLSVAATWERVRKLEQAGIIRGYRAEIDREQLQPTSRVLVEITLSRHTAADFERFEQRMREASEVVQCHATGGGIDYIAMIEAESIEAYQTFIDQLLADDLAIERYFSYVVTKSVVER